MVKADVMISPELKEEIKNEGEKNKTTYSDYFRTCITVGLNILKGGIINTETETKETNKPENS